MTAAALVACTAPVVLALGVDGPARALVGLVLLAAPGVCVAAAARLDDVLLTVMVAIATAMCISVVVALALLYVHQWGVVQVAVATSLITLVLAAVTIPHGRTP